MYIPDFSRRGGGNRGLIMNVISLIFQTSFDPLLDTRLNVKILSTLS